MKRKSLIAFILCLIVLSATLVGCTKDIDYNVVTSYKFWKNKANQAIPQYQSYHIMNEFLSDGTIQDGKIIGANGKVKKVAFIGFDGTRADTLPNIMYNDFATNSYVDKAEYSGINELSELGGLYLAYCGGDSKATKQATSTSPGWTTHLTGVWNDKHGVNDNGIMKNIEYKSILLQYAEKGLNTTLAFDWGDLFDSVFVDEIDYKLKNNIMTYNMCDIDRPFASNTSIAKKNENVKEKDDLKAKNLDFYNAVSNPSLQKDSIIDQNNPILDSAMRDYIIDRIEKDDDIIAGIFHRPDTNGHTDGFTNDNNTYVNAIRNCDNYVYQIMQVIKEREQNNNEEWLILVTADHGGIKKGHGGQSYAERTIWIACNKEIDSKYFSKDYTGKIK